MTFEEVQAEFAPLVRGAVRQAVPETDAPDVEAEVWISVLGALKHFEGRSSMKTWLFRIVERRIADYRRGKHRDRRVLLEAKKRAQEAPSPAVEERAATVMPTAGELRVLRALARGLDNAEIARSRYISRETVRSHVKALYKKLKLKNRGELCILAHRFLGGES